MNKLKKRNGRVYCDMCNQSFLDEAACEPFLKDGETVVECIERNRKDTGMVLRLLVQEMSRVDQLRAERDRLREAATRIQQMVDAQALDEGLWFMAETAAEAYLQQELRRLHAALEPKPEPAPESAYVVFEPGDLFIGFFRDKDAAQRLIGVRPKTYVVEYVRAVLQDGK